MASECLSLTPRAPAPSQQPCAAARPYPTPHRTPAERWTAFRRRRGHRGRRRGRRLCARGARCRCPTTARAPYSRPCKSPCALPRSARPWHTGRRQQAFLLAHTPSCSSDQNAAQTRARTQPTLCRVSRPQSLPTAPTSLLPQNFGGCGSAARSLGRRSGRCCHCLYCCIRARVAALSRRASRRSGRGGSAVQRHSQLSPSIFECGICLVSIKQMLYA